MIAVFTFGIVNGVVAAPLARHEGASSIGLIVALGALVLAGLSLLWGPVALVALLAIIWLGSARRRRAQRKYEAARPGEPPAPAPVRPDLECPPLASSA